MGRSSIESAPVESAPVESQPVELKGGVYELHGETFEDPLSWLSDRESPAVRARLTAENERAERFLEVRSRLRTELYEEMVARLVPDDISVPARHDTFWYYRRQVEGGQRMLHCRKEGSLDAEEQILLDENVLAAGHPYCAVAAMRISRNHQWLAYSVDFDGSERQHLYVRDLARDDPNDLTGDVLITDHAHSFCWANDSATLFYTLLDDANRPDRVYRHSRGSDPATDPQVFAEADAALRVSLQKTSSHAFVLCVAANLSTTELWYLEADQPQALFKLFRRRRENVRYTVNHRGDTFYILTNEEARNFKVMETPSTNPEVESWRTLVPHREDVCIERLMAFEDHLVLFERVAGQSNIQVLHLGGESHTVSMPEEVSAVFPGDNRMFQTDTLRFVYTSLTTPLTVFDYNMTNRQLVRQKETEVPGGYRRQDYATERLWAVAADGVRIPISVVYATRHRQIDGNPLVLYAYGAYGISIEPVFDQTHLSLLDRGVTFAIAHVRGGGEMGRAWHEQGRLGHKQKSIDDFIACAEHLIAEGYTRAAQLAAYGESAGGTLVGAAINQRPELFAAVVAVAPFVCVIETLLDESLPLTPAEWEEWGNPREITAFQWQRAYSPYDNVSARPYPAILATAGFQDSRVGYWEPAKWIARVRQLGTGDAPALLYVDMDVGHSGSSGRYDELRDTARIWTFLLDRLGAVTDEEESGLRDC